MLYILYGFQKLDNVNPLPHLPGYVEKKNIVHNLVESILDHNINLHVYICLKYYKQFWFWWMRFLFKKIALGYGKCPGD